LAPGAAVGAEVGAAVGEQKLQVSHRFQPHFFSTEVFTSVMHQSKQPDIGGGGDEIGAEVGTEVGASVMGATAVGAADDIGRPSAGGTKESSSSGGKSVLTAGRPLLAVGARVTVGAMVGARVGATVGAAEEVGRPSAGGTKVSGTSGG